MYVIRSFLLIILLAITSCLVAQGLCVKKLLEWSQKGYYILNPAIANKDGGIAFVCRLSGKDSTVVGSGLLKGAKVNYINSAKRNIRFYDPVVCLFDIKSKRLSLIDYGWSPAFSPNDNRLVYSFQMNSLQEGDRLFATAYEGNGIKIFNIVTHQFEDLAIPERDYFSDPHFIDSLNIVYKTGNRVNGPYGADISFTQLNIDTKKSTLIYQPSIKYKLNDLMGKPYLIDNKIAYTVYSPADSGAGVAGAYLHLLLSGKDTLHNFGVRKFSNLNYKFAIDGNKDFLFLDDGYYMAEDTNYIVTYKNNIVVDKKPLPQDYVTGYLSPHGKYLLYFTLQKEAFILDISSFNKTKIDMPQKELHAVTWSDDETKLVLVTDHEKLIGTDELYFFEIK